MPKNSIVKKLPVVLPENLNQAPMVESRSSAEQILENEIGNLNLESISGVKQKSDLKLKSKSTDNKINLKKINNKKKSLPLKESEIPILLKSGDKLKTGEVSYFKMIVSILIVVGLGLGIVLFS